MMLTAIPFQAYAAEENALPFIDVPADKWYFNAVEYVYGKGYFSGISDTEFGPSVPMNRAMFVTVLSKLDETFNADDYNGNTGFDDVAPDAWYAKAVQWAVEKNITSGIGDNTFSPGSEITREQLAVMFYAFIKNQGKQLEDVKTSDIFKFGDIDKIRIWSKEAIGFMSHFGLMNGKSVVNGAPIFDPLGKATRAEVAQIVMSSENVNYSRKVPINDLRLNGNPIAEYVIIYGETGTKTRDTDPKDIAERFQSVIKDATGITLDIYKDAERSEIVDKEVRIGRTNREDILPLDRDGILDDGEYYALIGDTLIFASSEEYGGTVSAMYDFLHDQIGYTCYGPVTVIEPVDRLDVPSGVSKRYNPQENYRMNLANLCGNDYQLHNKMDTMSMREAMLVHTLPEFARDDFLDHLYTDHWAFHVEHHKDMDPCLTDEHNLDNIITGVKALIQRKINEKSGTNFLWVTQGDGLIANCKCENCVKVYRTFGRCATYVHCVQYVCDAIKDEYPDWTIIGLAYVYTLYPPKFEVSDEEYAKFLETFPQGKYVPRQDMRFPDNAIMCICTDGVCMAHAIGDPNCNHPAFKNANFLEWMKEWKKISDKLWIWDYLGPDNYPHEAFPNIYQMYYNFQVYNDLGVSGTYVMGMSGTGDFCALKTYLTSVLQWDGKMTWEQYSEYVNKFLEAYYGSGWTYVREYIDIMQALEYKNEYNIWGGNNWDRIVTAAQYADNLDYLKCLCDKAIGLAEMDGNEEQIKWCKRLGQQVIYAELMVEYERYLSDSTDEYQEILERYKTIMKESGLEAPRDYGGDPNNWKMPD